MRVEMVNLIPDEASAWLLELFEFVVGELSPDFEKLELMIVQSFQQAKTRMREPAAEIGLTGIVRGLEGVQEYSPWKSAVNLKSNGFTLIEKPQRIREQDATYEEVTEGMAHELAEGLVMKHNWNDWYYVSRDQLEILRNQDSNWEITLKTLAMVTRERLADKYYAEHGFEKLAFCALTGGQHMADRIYGFELSMKGGTKFANLATSLFALGLDKSISLHAAGEHQLADEWLELWSSQVKTANSLVNFVDYYKNFRQEYLSMPLTTDSLLTLHNSKIIESI